MCVCVCARWVISQTVKFAFRHIQMRIECETALIFRLFSVCPCSICIRLSVVYLFKVNSAVLTRTTATLRTIRPLPRLAVSLHIPILFSWLAAFVRSFRLRLSNFVQAKRDSVDLTLKTRRPTRTCRATGSDQTSQPTHLELVVQTSLPIQPKSFH